MNCEKHVDLYVDNRLKRWGIWCDKILTGSLGYPPSSAFTKIGESRSQEKKSVEAVTPQDEEAQQTEEAVQMLFKHKKKLAEIIRINYVSGGSGHDKAKRLGVSYDSYKKQLTVARAWISGFILRS